MSARLLCQPSIAGKRVGRESVECGTGARHDARRPVEGGGGGAAGAAHIRDDLRQVLPKRPAGFGKEPDRFGNGLLRRGGEIARVTRHEISDTRGRTFDRDERGIEMGHRRVYRRERGLCLRQPVRRGGARLADGGARAGRASSLRSPISRRRSTSSSRSPSLARLASSSR